MYAVQTFESSGLFSKYTACEKHLNFIKSKATVLSVKFVASTDCQFCEKENQLQKGT